MIKGYRSPILLAVLIGFVLLGYQNCAPVGGASIDLGSSTSSESSSDGANNSNNSGTTPPSPTADDDDATPPPPPPPPDICDNNRRPKLMGAFVQGGSPSLNNISASFVNGMGNEASGDRPIPNNQRIRIRVDKNGDNSQAHFIRCVNVTQIDTDGDGDFLDTGNVCNNNQFNTNLNDTVDMTLDIDTDDNEQCRTGTAILELSVRDECDNSQNASDTVQVTINVTSGCVSEHKVEMPNIVFNRDNVGVGVDIDGSTFAVAASGDDEGGFNTGSVLVFNRTGSGGNNASFVAKLLPSDIAAGDSDNSRSEQGELRAVAISGNYIAAGSPASGGFAGTVYIFKNVGGTWSQIQRITPPAPANTDDSWFGYSVAMNGSRLVVGAHEDNEAGVQAGAIYVYDRSGDNFTLNRKITASNGAARHFFGFSVDIDDSGNIAVGAPVRSLDDDVGPGQVYHYASGSFTEKRLFQSVNLPNGSQLGFDVAVDGGRVVAGAPRANGNSFSDNGAGAAYVTTVSSDSVTELNAANERDGHAVDISGSRIAVGSIDDNSRQGSITYFHTSNLSKKREIYSRDRRNGDQFGYSIAIDGNHGVVGSWLDDVRQGSTTFDRAGSAYLLNLNPPNF